MAPGAGFEPARPERVTDLAGLLPTTLESYNLTRTPRLLIQQLALYIINTFCNLRYIYSLHLFLKSWQWI